MEAAGAGVEGEAKEREINGEASNEQRGGRVEAAGGPDHGKGRGKEGRGTLLGAWRREGRMHSGKISKQVRCELWLGCVHAVLGDFPGMRHAKLTRPMGPIAH